MSRLEAGGPEDDTRDTIPPDHDIVTRQTPRTPSADTKPACRRTCHDPEPDQARADELRPGRPDRGHCRRSVLRPAVRDRPAGPRDVSRRPRRAEEEAD